MSKNDDVIYGKKLAFSATTRRVYLLTKWRENPDGMVTPVQQHDMTDDFHRCASILVASMGLTMVRRELVHVLEELHRIFDSQAEDVFAHRTKIIELCGKLMEVYRSSHEKKEPVPEDEAEAPQVAEQAAS